MVLIPVPTPYHIILNYCTYWPLNRNGILYIYCCCNKWLQIYQLITPQIYYFIVMQIRSLGWLNWFVFSRFHKTRLVSYCQVLNWRLWEESASRLIQFLVIMGLSLHFLLALSCRPSSAFCTWAPISLCRQEYLTSLSPLESLWLPLIPRLFSKFQPEKVLCYWGN